MITDKPDELERRARELSETAERFELSGYQQAAREKRDEATRLRERAAQLRKKRTDGIRFG